MPASLRSANDSKMLLTVAQISSSICMAHAPPDAWVLFARGHVERRAGLAEGHHQPVLRVAIAAPVQVVREYPADRFHQALAVFAFRPGKPGADGYFRIAHRALHNSLFTLEYRQSTAYGCA